MSFYARKMANVAPFNRGAGNRLEFIPGSFQDRQLSAHREAEAGKCSWLRTAAFEAPLAVQLGFADGMCYWADQSAAERTVEGGRRSHSWKGRADSHQTCL